ncbi:MAG: TerC family protein [Acidimicrobiales bacterium]|nr:TerC family protein [Acidimicrobiales bacterium]NNF08829.1 TerC family protein [Acidimicrobiia bacterium]
MEWLSDPAAWSALAALLTLEIVLGVDNVVFISILASKLPAHQQDRARQTGILAAAGMRVLLLLAIGWIITLESELFSVFDRGFSGKDLVLFAGGLFLIYKATREIHHKLEGEDEHAEAKVAPTFAAVIAQVMLLDLVFSIDSVITAVGITEYVPVMIIAILAAVVVMLVASKGIYRFVNQHPSVKMLALAFLLLIGMTLIAEGLGEKIPKGYVYTAMAFSIFVELLNIGARRRRKSDPVHLHDRMTPEPTSPYRQGSPLEASQT